MKRTKTAYWIVTVIMSALILLGAIIDVIKSDETVAFIKHLGYPEYFIRFIGVLKILGIVAILIPISKRIKEWAYAGLVFDIVGAIFSHLSSGDGIEAWLPATIAILLVLSSYVLYVYSSKNSDQTPIIND